MLSLLINNTSIFLPETLNFGLVRESPLFNGRGDYSYPFTVPYEPNAQTFGYIKQIEATQPSLPLTFTLRWCEEILLKGLVPTFRLVGKNIQMTLIGGKTAFNYLLKNVYLDELDLGSEDASLNPTNVARWTDTLSTNNGMYVFAPIHAPELLSGNDALQNIFSSEIINAWDPDNDKLQEIPLNTFCMHIYIQYLLTKLADITGYQITRNDLEAYTDFDEAYLVSLNKIESSASFTFEYAKALPHLLVSDFLDMLDNTTNLKIIPSDVTKTLRIVLLKNILTDAEVESKHNYAEITGKKIEADVRDPKNLTLQWSVSGDDYKYETTEVAVADIYGTLASRNNLPTASSANEGRTFLISATNKKYTCVGERNELDVMVYSWALTGEMADYESGDEYTETDEISAGAEILPARETEVNTITVEIPYTSRQGSAKHYIYEEQNDFPLIMAFYRGIKTFSGKTYPVSSYDLYQLNEDNVGNASLKWEGSNGLYMLFHQVVWNWEQNHKKETQKYMDITVADAFALDFVKKYFINDLSFLIDKIHINFGRDHIKSIRLDLYTAPGGYSDDVPWILDDGTWNDDGVWKDTEVWKDS